MTLSRCSLDNLFLWTFFSVLHKVLNISLKWGRWYWSSTHGYTVCFFKWLWIVWMYIEIWLLISEFVVDSCLESVILVIISQCVQKWNITRWNVVFKLIVLYLLFKFSKNNSSSCLAPVRIMNISSIYCKYSIGLFLIYRYIYIYIFFSNCTMKIFAYTGAQIIYIYKVQ